MRDMGHIYIWESAYELCAAMLVWEEEGGKERTGREFSVGEPENKKLAQAAAALGFVELLSDADAPSQAQWIRLTDRGRLLGRLARANGEGDYKRE